MSDCIYEYNLVNSSKQARQLSDPDLSLSFRDCRRQKEQEQKSIEDAANKRIEELVEKRVAEELERRRDEIEAEVLRRVEEAKKVMEAEMLLEMERRKQEQLEEAKRREVFLIFFCLSVCLSATAARLQQQQQRGDTDTDTDTDAGVVARRQRNSSLKPYLKSFYCYNPVL